MADTAVAITAGTGTNIDTRTEATNGNHRQVIVVGDPSTNAGVAPVDATAGLKVDLGADNDVTVTGTVTAELSATDNAVLDNIDADLTTIIGHVDGIETILGTIDADTSNISTKIDTIAGDTTSIQTAVELIDDAVYTDGTGTVTKGIAILGQDGTNPQAIKTDANGELQVDVLTMPTVAVTQSGTWDEVGINDSGNSITVDASQLDIDNLNPTDDIVAIGDGTSTATVRNLAANDALNVAIVDGSGDQITSFGGGTQYTEGDTDSTITGTAMLFETNTGTSALGVVSASNPLPISDNGGAITVDGTVAVTNADITSIKTAVEIIDNAISGSEMQVDVVSSALPTGASTLAEQQSQTTHLATIAGDTTAIETATQLIDDMIYVDDADWTDSTSKHALVGGLYQSTPQTVTDGDVAPFNITANGALHVSDAGGSLTVDGTVTANLSATDNAVLDNIDADLTTIIGHVDGIEALLTTIDADTSNLSVVGGGTEAAALRVTIANNSTGVVSVDDNGGALTVDGTVAVTNGGTFAVQVDGNALTSLQLADDVVYVDDADWTADTSKHTLVGGVTQTTPTANTDGDTTPLITNNLRELRVAAKESDLAAAGTTHVKKYYTSAGAATDGIIWSPAAGKRWYCTLLTINVSAACTVTIEDDLAGGDSPVYKAELAANSGVVLPFGADAPMFSGEDAADLLITTTAGNVYVTAVGYEI